MFRLSSLPLPVLLSPLRAMQYMNCPLLHFCIVSGCTSALSHCFQMHIMIVVTTCVLMALKPFKSSCWTASVPTSCMLGETTQNFLLQPDDTVQHLWCPQWLVARLLDEARHGLGPEWHRAAVPFKAWCAVGCFLWLRGARLASHAGLPPCPCSTLSSMPAHTGRTSS